MFQTIPSTLSNVKFILSRNYSILIKYNKDHITTIYDHYYTYIQLIIEIQ